MNHKQIEPAKRHCMVVHAYYPLGEVRVQREAEALLDRGYQVDVICLRHAGEPATDSHHGANIYRLPVQRHKRHGVVVQFLEYLAFFALAFAKLTSLHIRLRYDVIQVHNLPDFLVFAAFVPKLSGVPVILDLHDLMPEFFASRFGAGRASLPMKAIRLQEKLACRFADHVITVTEHWRQSLIKRGVPPDKCTVLMNLADPRVFKKTAPPPSKSQTGDQFRLIYHGSIPCRYGLDLVLRAMDQVRAEISGIYFDIVGHGEHLPELIRLATELHLEDHVSFEGIMPVESLPERIVAADLAVVPYHSDVFTDELLPTKLLEYVAMGVPAIVSRTTGISAYFDETMVQFFTPGNVQELADSIRTLYRDRERLATLARNAAQFNLRYNWETQSADYARLVERLGKSKRKHKEM